MEQPGIYALDNNEHESRSPEMGRKKNLLHTDRKISYGLFPFCSLIYKFIKVSYLT